MSDIEAKMHQNRFRVGLGLKSRWRNLQCSHRLSSWNKGDQLLREEEGYREGKGRWERRRPVASLGLVSPGGGNWRCYPFSLKNDHFFIAIALCKVIKSDDLFSRRLVTTLSFRRRLSSVLSEYIQPPFFISFGCRSPPGRRHPGRSAPLWRHCGKAREREGKGKEEKAKGWRERPCVFMP